MRVVGQKYNTIHIGQDQIHCRRSLLGQGLSCRLADPASTAKRVGGLLVGRIDPLLLLGLRKLCAFILLALGLLVLLRYILVCLALALALGWTWVVGGCSGILDFASISGRTTRSEWEDWMLARGGLRASVLVLGD